MRIVYLRAMVRELNARGFSNLRLAEAAGVSIEDLMRLMEFGSRPDAICELRLMAFAAGVLVTRRKQLDRAPFALPGAIRPAIQAAVSPTGEDGRSVAQHRF